MADQKSVGGKKNRKYGRNKTKCQLYRQHNVREWNKLRRILQSNGLIFAQWWAHKYNAESILEKILKGAKNGRLYKQPAAKAG